MPAPTSVTLTIDGTWNARDVATLTGLRPGVLFRTASLSQLSDTGREQLLALGITDTIDLRGEGEVLTAGQDAVPDGVRIRRCPITADAQVAPTAQGHAEQVERYVAALRNGGIDEAFLTATYAELMSSPETARSIGAGLRVLAQPDTVLAVHCAAGKDRTGIFCAIAATIAGADEASIEADYLYSNEAIEQQRAGMPDLGDIDTETLRPLLGVDLRALRAARAALIDSYGSLPAFLAAAGVDEATTEQIRSRLAP